MPRPLRARTCSKHRQNNRKQAPPPSNRPQQKLRRLKQKRVP